MKLDLVPKNNYDPERQCRIVCEVCDIESTPEGHDGCIGTLPNVMNACCGHGGTHEGVYVQLSPEVTIRGQEAIDYIKEHRQQHSECLWPQLPGVDGCTNYY